jgi:SOS response regulatory protein OraA/RecX
VVADLVGRGYVDDAAFARHWVETRAARGLGAARLAAELRPGAWPRRCQAALAGDHWRARRTLPPLHRGASQRARRRR